MEDASQARFETYLKPPPSTADAHGYGENSLESTKETGPNVRPPLLLILKALTA